MTPISKALVLAGAVSMAVTPVVATASGSSMSVINAGGAGGGAAGIGGLKGLEIALGVIFLVGGGFLVFHKSKSN